MKPASFTYHAPRTLNDALVLVAGKSNARLLAGGQSLMPMLNMRIVYPDHLIDLNRVKELAGIRERNGMVVIGAMTRQSDIEFSPIVHESLPLLAEAITWTGHRQTRNRGTIGGSLCHLDPSAEQPTVAAAMEAVLEVAGPDGKRDIPMRDFGVALMTNALADGEILTAIRFAPWSRHHGWAFTEFARRHGDFAIVSAAVLLELDEQGIATRVSLTLGGVATAPLRMAAAEQRLLGSRVETEDVDTAALLCAEVDALDDPQAPAWYRRRLARVLVGRALPVALKRAKEARQ